MSGITVLASKRIMKYLKILAVFLLCQLLEAKNNLEKEVGFNLLLRKENIYLVVEDSSLSPRYKKLYKSRVDLLHDLKKAEEIPVSNYFSYGGFLVPESIQKRYKWFIAHEIKNYQTWIFVLTNRKIYRVMIYEGINEGKIERFCGVFLAGTGQGQFYKLK